jgi:signal recognition particle subunit SRP54
VMKAMGTKRGPMAGMANMLGLGGLTGGMPSPEQLAKLAEKMPGGLPGAGSGLPPNFPGLPGGLPGGGLPGGVPGLGGPKLPGGLPPGFPGFGKKK